MNSSSVKFLVFVIVLIAVLSAAVAMLATQARYETPLPTPEPMSLVDTIAERRAAERGGGGFLHWAIILFGFAGTGIGLAAFFMDRLGTAARQWRLTFGGRRGKRTGRRRRTAGAMGTVRNVGYMDDGDEGRPQLPTSPARPQLPARSGGSPPAGHDPYYGEEGMQS